MQIIKKHLSIVAIVLIALISGCSLSEQKTVTPVNPQVPNSPNPDNNALNASTALTLSWAAENAESYDIYLDTKNPPSTLYASNRTKNNLSVFGLKNSTRYYWRVVAKHSDGTSVEGPVWTFATRSAGGTTGDGYYMVKHDISTEPPSIVKVLFQVIDYNGVGADGLVNTDFEIFEDGEPITSESNLNIKKRDESAYTLKTVLLIDNSTSLDGYLTELINAAKVFVNNIIPVQQQVAIYKFSEEAILVQDFTNDKATLNAALNTINVEYPTTNLYGAIIDVVDLWEDTFSSDEIVQGALVVFTDGTDTQGSYDIGQAKEAIGSRSVYTIGLGDEIDPDVLEILGSTGEFLYAGNIDELSSKFIEVGDLLKKFANSFYWMQYTSPKRQRPDGDNNHNIRLQIIDNPADSYIEGTFSSDEFFSVEPGIYINSSQNKPTGITEIDMSVNSSYTLTVVSYLQDNAPVFVWSVPVNNTLITIEPVTGRDDKVFINSGSGTGTAVVKVVDSANGNIERTVTINITN
ncbi:MAG: VWA domain-containing protein [Melioribacteraceae bacterium]|nr:VWA domain-containing protein [Melioribacteraceae bacterium]MCF8355116.1 VWA domain-containing protein [Melioribacteraceae bacterium]MCF8392407.1 VWA domain-containing protein [Melioribacteraceae bacterium]MCF8417928.1 VWA domain-containing protein [Melioribacteraceae bacterium]